MQRGRGGSQESHRVGAELPVLFGPAVRFCSALVETQHELQVLVRFLLVRQRPVVRAFVPRGALLTPPVSPRCAAMGGHVLSGQHPGAGGVQEEDKTGQDAHTGRLHFGINI